MGHSQALRPRDIRSAYQLLGEVTELGIDPHAWRQHALANLCARLGGRVGISLELNNFLPNSLAVSIDPLDVGFDGMNERLGYVRYLQSNERAVDPSNVALTTARPHRKFLTVRRHEIIGDSKWYGSPVTSESRRSSNVDHYVCSLYRLRSPGSTTGFIFYKNWNEPEFDERSLKFLRLFHVMLLKKLFRTYSENPAPWEKLPHHLRQVLRQILDGRSTKQVAESLDLSVHTIKSYTKDLYARLDVHSRGELLAQFLNFPQSRPILMPEGLRV